ncbi:23S rRNA (guanosine(2251)-2'-O)-methyltransferase RlmB [Piscinibacterium candidicorallinum]|jgi:23S rRNA (guanosine2251-2'-O)-methyltransferase|uniref:23S rRNA (guanosine-2'-O-)-methyltransferase RlmB n=1 Tax=Piscinibacterium candidicorallinum TaxID=1793872 RepID=A0ABV7H2F8_9BURK
MSKPQLLFGFHAVRTRLRSAPASVKAIYVETTRHDKRMQDLLRLAAEFKLSVHQVDGERLDRMAGTSRHQGVVAQADTVELARSLDDLLDTLTEPPLLLLLDGVTDPHNLGACLRVADGAGAHAVVAPRDRSCGINATVSKVASGAADTVPYFAVTNLARTMEELKERNIWITGTSDAAKTTLFDADLRGATALVLGAEGEGMRRLTGERCDQLVSIPMAGSVESLNVSVAAGVCLFEAVRQRRATA